MKRLLVGFALLATALAGAAQAQDHLGKHQAAVLSIGKSGPETFSIVPAGTNLSWAAWSDDAGKKRSVRFALLQRKAGTAAVLWSELRDSGYAPSITAVPAWMYEGGEVMMFSYQLGAAYTHADFYGIDRQGKPAKLGSLEGALIVAVPAGGVSVLKVYESADLKSVSCYGWNTASHSPHERACP